MKNSFSMLRETQPIPEILSLWNGVICNAISETGTGDIFGGPSSGSAFQVMVAIREIGQQKAKYATRDNPLYIFSSNGTFLCKTWAIHKGDDYSFVNEYKGESRESFVITTMTREFGVDDTAGEWDGSPYTLRVMKPVGAK